MGKRATSKLFFLLFLACVSEATDPKQSIRSVASTKEIVVDPATTLIVDGEAPEAHRARFHKRFLEAIEESGIKWRERKKEDSYWIKLSIKSRTMPPAAMFLIQIEQTEEVKVLRDGAWTLGHAVTWKRDEIYQFDNAFSSLESNIARGIRDLTGQYLDLLDSQPVQESSTETRPSKTE